jgi:hypothetical protein
MSGCSPELMVGTGRYGTLRQLVKLPSLLSRDRVALLCLHASIRRMIVYPLYWNEKRAIGAPRNLDYNKPRTHTFPVPVCIVIIFYILVSMHFYIVSSARRGSRRKIPPRTLRL